MGTALGRTHALLAKCDDYGPVHKRVAVDVRPLRSSGPAARCRRGWLGIVSRAITSHTPRGNPAPTPDASLSALPLPADFTDSLEAAYREAGLVTPRNLWQAERDAALAACEALEEALAPRYAVIRPLGVGGGGIALLVEDLHFASSGSDAADTQDPTRSFPQRYAVAKIARPVSGDEDRMNELLYSEARRLAEADHANVIKLFDVGARPDAGGRTIHYYVMEYIEAAADALQYLAQDPSETRVIDILYAALQGTHYLHDRLGLVHTDIKPANLFCSPGGRVVVADFGFAKKLPADGVPPAGITTNVGGTAEFMHPALQHYIDELTPSLRDTNESNRQAAREYPRSQLDRLWDVYSLGVTLLYLLTFLDRAKPAEARNYKRRYLRLMAYRMLDGESGYARQMNRRSTLAVAIDGNHYPVTITETVLGLPPTALTELKYLSVADVLSDLQKLRGETDLIGAIPELGRHQEDMVQAASHGPVPFSKRVEKIVNAPEVRALGHLPQLGLVRFVYPTATHSRLEHTLGAFGMACRMMAALCDDPINPLFRQIMTEEDLKAGLLAALLHDIGHYPLAHDLEEVSRQVFAHDDRTQRILRRNSGELFATMRDMWEVTPERIGSILSIDRGGDSVLKNEILLSVLDSPIDADKIDYIIRDSENLRLPFGRGVDYEKLLQALTTVVIPDARDPLKYHGEIGIQERGRIAAESLAFARYALYGASYWHRTHRAAKAMLHRLASGVLRRAYVDKGRENYVRSLRNELDSLLGQTDELQIPLSGFSHVMRFAHVDAGSEAMLRWLQERTDDGAKQLADDLLERRLMPRVFVGSQMRPDSDIDWNAVRRLFGSLGESWRERLKVTEDVAQGVAEIVAEWDGKQRVPGSVANTTLAQSFVNDVEHGRAVLIVDFPPIKTGSGSGLRFLREEEWTEGVVDPFRVDSVDESPVWKAVTESGYETMGKLRVFCEKQYAPVVRQAVLRNRLEAILNDAIRKQLA